MLNPVINYVQMGCRIPSPNVKDNPETMVGVGDESLRLPNYIFGTTVFHGK